MHVLTPPTVHFKVVNLVLCVFHHEHAGVMRSHIGGGGGVACASRGGQEGAVELMAPVGAPGGTQVSSSARSMDVWGRAGRGCRGRLHPAPCTLHARWKALRTAMTARPLGWVWKRTGLKWLRGGKGAGRPQRQPSEAPPQPHTDILAKFKKKSLY